MSRPTNPPSDEVIDEEDNAIRCIHCKSEIEGKPWISVRCGKDEIVHACNYICSNRLSFYIGSGYWERVINKEDFPGPRPVFQTINSRRDITVNFGIEEIRREIEDEEKRIEELEAYESDESFDYMSP